MARRVNSTDVPTALPAPQGDLDKPSSSRRQAGVGHLAAAPHAKPGAAPQGTQVTEVTITSDLAAARKQLQIKDNPVLPDAMRAAFTLLTTEYARHGQ